MPLGFLVGVMAEVSTVMSSLVMILGAVATTVVHVVVVWGNNIGSTSTTLLLLPSFGGGPFWVAKLGTADVAFPTSFFTNNDSELGFGNSRGVTAVAAGNRAVGDLSIDNREPTVSSLTELMGTTATGGGCSTAVHLPMATGFGGNITAGHMLVGGGGNMTS